jgi:hypothetical protein
MCDVPYLQLDRDEGSLQAMQQHIKLHLNFQIPDIVTGASILLFGLWSYTQ